MPRAPPTLPPQGRAACEIDTADELLATELMFNGTFNSLDKHQLVALVSTLVPVEKSNVRARGIRLSVQFSFGCYGRRRRAACSGKRCREP